MMRPAVRVVLRVRARDEQQVQRQPQGVAADLDVALLEHVQQRHLDALGEVGQLVDGEDAAVGARHQPVVHRLGIAEGAALGDLHRVDVADQVADAGVRSGQLLAVPLAAVLPPDRQSVAELHVQPAAPRADRRLRVVVDLAAVDHRRPLVQQGHQGADQPGLALPALAEQHDVVAGEQRPLQRRKHRLVEADDALEPRASGAQQVEQVLAHLGLHRTVPVAAGAQLSEGGGSRSVGHDLDRTSGGGCFPGRYSERMGGCGRPPEFGAATAWRSTPISCAPRSWRPPTPWPPSVARRRTSPWSSPAAPSPRTSPRRCPGPASSVAPGRCWAAARPG